MFSFIRRFIFAWRFARNPKRLDALIAVARDQEALAKWRGQLHDNAQKLIAGLMTVGAGYSQAPYFNVTLTMRCENIMTDDEAKQVMAESKITRCFGPGEKPDPKIMKEKSKALVEHNKRFE